MQITKVTVVTFSPCGSTEEISCFLAELLASKLSVPCSTDNFTLPSSRKEKRCYSSSDLVVFSVPTYAGRIPNKVLPFVQTLFSGNNTPVIPLVTFGNRSFDNSLKELRNELCEHGFCPVAAAALPSRHVFSHTLGNNRPDDDDRKLLTVLADKTAAVLQKAGSATDILPPVLPDDDLPVGPYYTPLDEEGNPSKFLKAVPVTDLTKCDRCGICAEVCPMGSVSSEHPDEMTGICIKCQACIRKCPQQARCFTDPAMLSHIRMLESHYQRRADAMVFQSAGTKETSA